MPVESRGILGHPGFCCGKLETVVDGGGEGSLAFISSCWEGLPRMADRIEYSILAAVEPKVYDGSIERL